jgi:MFS transporter, ACS family, D-galactonate transporter
LHSLSGVADVPRRRWRIAFLLAFGVVVAFFDRVNLSVSQTSLNVSFGISTVAFGYLSSAYNGTYALMQIPCGLLLDRFGVRRIGRIGALLWSIASFGAAVSTGVSGFVAARFLLGVGESPTFPGNAKAIGYWFPARERSLAMAITDSAAKFSTAIGVPFLGILLLHFGWRWSFAATGFISLFYFGLFWRVYRNPSEDGGLSDAERQLIGQGSAQPEGKSIAGQSPRSGICCRSRKCTVWHWVGGLTITRFSCCWRGFPATCYFRFISICFILFFIQACHGCLRRSPTLRLADGLWTL